MVRIGLIGCGGNMRAHIRRLLAVPGAEIVAIGEPSEANVAVTRETYPALAETPVYGSHKEMLDSLKPDAVEISTPHTLHFEQIMDSLDAGCHVLCEKPMVCSSEEAYQVVERARASGKVMMVSYQRHQQALYRWMRRPNAASARSSSAKPPGGARRPGSGRSRWRRGTWTL